MLLGTVQSVDKLHMPKRIDISVPGLRRSDQIKAKNLAEAEAKKQTQSIPVRNTAVKKLLGLFTILSFVSHVEIPNHQVTYTDRIIKGPNIIPNTMTIPLIMDYISFPF